MNILAKTIIAQAAKTPHFALTEYMDRSWLTPDPKQHPDQKISQRVHHILRADQEDVHHDHPFENTSLILSGYYIERLPLDQAQDAAWDKTRYIDVKRRTGDTIYRKATDRHTIIEVGEGGVWTLWTMGEWQRDWGFHTPDKWVFWREYLDQWEPDPPPGGSKLARRIK
jgi:hypothetical protein